MNPHDLIPGIEPFHEEEAGVIYCGDSLEIMPLMPDKCVDLVLTDPPYGVGTKYDNYEDSEERWIDLLNECIPLMRKIGTMTILPSCQIKKLDWFYINHKPDWMICWYKGSTGCASFVGFNDWEPHLVYGKNNTNMHDYFAATNNEKLGNYGHPCPKPIKWAKWLISRATKEKSIILDPFLGSGTTAVAAKELGRFFIGIEISEEYCKIAVKRLKQSCILAFEEKPCKKDAPKDILNF